jgi:hypothetical protein
VHVLGTRSPSHLIQESSEWGVPYWLAGYTSLVPLPNDRILAAHGPPHHHCLTIIDAAAATFADIPSDYSSISHSFSVNASRTRAFAVAAGAHTPYCLVELDLHQAKVTHVIDSIVPPCKPEYLPVPRPICVSGSGGRSVHAILHPATHPGYSASGATPLIVTAHGGPTSAATAALRLKFAYAAPALPARLHLLILCLLPQLLHVARLQRGGRELRRLHGLRQGVSQRAAGAVGGATRHALHENHSCELNMAVAAGGGR